MSKISSRWVGTLVSVGAIGAMAGMLAWRFSQRHRMQRQSFYRDLSRWEGEGGSLAGTADDTGPAPEMAVAGGPAVREHDAAPRRGMKGAVANGASSAASGVKGGANGANGGANSSANGGANSGANDGASSMPWPFPRG